VADYNRHNGYVDKIIEWQIWIPSTVNHQPHGSGRRNPSICWTWPFRIATSISFIGDKKISHSDFRDIPLGNLLTQAGHERIVQRPIGRPPAAVTQVFRFEDRGRKHWPIRLPREDVFVRARVSPEMFQ
jgi:hypothetical protein